MKISQSQVNYHEAGHVLLAIHLNDIDFVLNMKSDEPGKMAEMFRSKERNFNSFDELEKIIIAYGGPEAEIFYSKESKSKLDEGDDSLISSLNFTPKQRSIIRNYVRSFIESNSNELHKIAQNIQECIDEGKINNLRYEDIVTNYLGVVITNLEQLKQRFLN